MTSYIVPGTHRATGRFPSHSETLASRAKTCWGSCVVPAMDHLSWARQSDSNMRKHNALMQIQERMNVSIWLKILHNANGI